jgi:general secretion pathway protein B
MSFLLDALRKSENQKRAGAVPTIHSTDHLETRRPRRRVPWLILVLFPTLLVLGWFGLPLLNPTVGTAEPEAVTGPAVTPAGVDPALETQVVQAPASRPKVVSEDPQRLPRIPRAVPGQEGARTPVENYLAPADSVDQEQEDREAEASRELVHDAEPLVSAIESLAVEPRQEAVKDDAYRQPRFSEISFWGLPESVRGNLEPPRITVLVFAEEPADRFLLTGGRRLAEGDSTASGMLLEEIRRNGAVFSYRKYRFLVSR